ncbi:MAG: flavodoxin family protein [Armatimonadota bacterium]
MASSNVLVVYHSKQDHTKRMAEAIARGAERGGADVDLKPVDSCEMSELTWADAIAVGSPSYFSNVAWQIKKLIDDSIRLYGSRRLRGKAGLAFSSAGTARDAKDCVAAIDKALGFHHGMSMLPGVVATDAESPEDVAERCDEAGADLARAAGKAVEE